MESEAIEELRKGVRAIFSDPDERAREMAVLNALARTIEEPTQENFMRLQKASWMAERVARAKRGETWL